MLYGSDQFGSDARSGNDGNTVLLLSFNGANASTAFIDSSHGNHAVTANGNAQISTAQSKFGGTSYIGDGTGDFLSLDGSSDFAFGTSDFTVDFWVRYTAVSAQIILYDSRPSGTNGLYPTIYSSATNKLIFFQSSSDRITGTTTLTTGVWYHVALARAGTSTKLFLNGTQEGSTYSDSNNYINGTSRPNLGAAGNAAGSYLNGHIDNLRVSKGFAIWTADFTPPPMPYGL